MSAATKRRSPAQVEFDNCVEGWQALARKLKDTPPPNWSPRDIQTMKQLAADAARLYAAIGRKDRDRLPDAEALARVAAWACRPEWKDVEGLSRVVAATFLETALEDARQLYEDTALHPDPDPTAEEVWSWFEIDAIRAAERGDYRPMAEILLAFTSPLDRELAGNPFIAMLRAHGGKLGRDAEILVASRILGGRAHNKRGRPKMTDEQRRARTPTHDAADEVPGIEAILTARFPSKTPAEIRNMAIDLAARRARISTEAPADTLYNYMQHPRKRVR